MATVGMQTAQTPLHAAALLGHTEIIRELLARGFSHEAHDRQVIPVPQLTVAPNLAACLTVCRTLQHTPALSLAILGKADLELNVSDGSHILVG